MERMTPLLFREWQAYAEIERFGEDREDARLAQLEATIWSLVRNTKDHPRPYKFEPYLNEFLIDMKERKRQRQTDDQKFDLLTSMLLETTQASAGQVVQRPRVQEPAQPVVT